MEKVRKAFSPAGISSFFEICDTTHGLPIENPAYIGARGGGFGLQKGISTQVSTYPSNCNKTEVFINNVIAPEAQTTKTVVNMLLKYAKTNYNVVVCHNTDVPIGAGFGTSAGGALTTSLALSNALGLSLTYNQIGRIAHEAEIKCKTGLGTVAPLMISGCVLTLEPGAPGVSIIDRIPLSPDYVIVAGVFTSISTQKILSSSKKRNEIKKRGKETLNAIIKEPNLENFLSCCWDFALKSGFVTDRIKMLAEIAKQTGAVGVAQNMVGEAIHAVTHKENGVILANAFNKILPRDKILVSEIDFQGARLVSMK